ncbi:MAG TPA: hypothetical protein VM009_06415 [Terriglobales bacterium]|nr:hypothetical protein [Terriglobales bacterium]
MRRLRPATVHPEADEPTLKEGLKSMEPLKGIDWKALLAASGAVLEGLLPKRETDRQEVLLALAEVDHRLRGNGRCEVCRAPVRAIMRTVSRDEAGQTREFGCLCRRCLEAEKAYSRQVTSYLSGVVFDDFVNKKDLVPRPQDANGKAAA